jgi:hypothetical protein
MTPALLTPLTAENVSLEIASWFSNQLFMATQEFHGVFAEPVEAQEKSASQIS